jgi:hypothetical protein
MTASLRTTGLKVGPVQWDSRIYMRGWIVVVYGRVNMIECQRCHHDSHSGHMCGEYNTVTIRDDVGFTMPPTGIVRSFIESICCCVQVGLL